MTLRRASATLLVAAGLGAVPATASAANLWATPNPAAAGSSITIKGSGWPVIEFCSRTIRLTVDNRSIGTVRVRTNGRFRFAWTIPSSTAAGRHAVRAKMRCESGKDGSPNPIRKKFILRVS